MGFIPGARLPLGDVNKDVGSRPRVFIGSGSGVHGGDGALLGQNFNSAFGTSTRSGNGIRSGPAGGRTSFSNYGPVLEARRQAKLAAADPGLSTRGTRGAPGRGARPVGGGLEGRGSRAMSGTRMAPGPMHGPGRAELAGVNRARASQRSRILENLDANRARAGSGFGARMADSRAGALAGKSQEQLAGRVMRNVEASRAGRTGGFKQGMSMVQHGPANPHAPMGAMHGPPSPIRSTPVSVRPRTPIMGAMHGPPNPHAPLGAMHGPPRPLLNAAENSGSGALRGGSMMQKFSKMSRGSKIGIGLGLAVAAGVASNRRGEGASPGRQSNARY